MELAVPRPKASGLPGLKAQPRFGKSSVRTHTQEERRTQHRRKGGLTAREERRTQHRRKGGLSTGGKEDSQEERRTHRRKEDSQEERRTHSTEERAQNGGIFRETRNGKDRIMMEEIGKKGRRDGQKELVA